MTKTPWETEHIGNLAIVRGSEDEIRSFCIQLKNYIKADVQDSINIEFVENETKNLVEKHRALSYLRNCFDIPLSKIDDPSLYPELHSELSDKEYQNPAIEEFNKLELTIPCLSASFLIEIFCPNQDPSEKYYCEKRYFKQKTVYNLLIFALLPVSFEMSVVNGQQQCTLKFADTEIASAQLICAQVKFALKIFIAKSICAMFKQIDATVFKGSYLKKMSDELGYAFLRTTDYNVYENKGSFYMYVLPNEFGEEPRKKIRFLLQNLFNTIQLFQCERCKKFVTTSSHEECVESSIFEQNEDMVFDRHNLLLNGSPSEFNCVVV